MPVVPLLHALLLPALVQVLPAPTVVVGPWSGAIEIPGMVLAIQVDFPKPENGSGTISIPEQGIKHVALADLKVEGAAISFRMLGIPGDPSFQGQLQADGSLRGTFTQGGKQCPFVLKPGALPAPAGPAPVAKASSERELSFPGFNNFPLNGTVRTAQGHGYFTVLVAGSGPTDRDWSNPLIRDPLTGKLISSHGGRDFAGWLAEQGLSSLRWDKRFIGSMDPKLDISLDAQSGDIRAALAFARTLLEAKGKKMLLVGHSEGALLSLLVAKDADALLLLALPPQSMAKTIVEQLKLQLPSDRAAANLAYLEKVFQAIRANQPAPEAGVEVFPMLVTNLVKPLMRAESLG
ncbi:MAG: hypothetical protein Q8O00_10595, partial [Holophaga sp.]|nr:hypothetical protein [Holophaga sp.]